MIIEFIIWWICCGAVCIPLGILVDWIFYKYPKFYISTFIMPLIIGPFCFIILVIAIYRALKGK